MGLTKYEKCDILCLQTGNRRVRSSLKSRIAHDARLCFLTFFSKLLHFLAESDIIVAKGESFKCAGTELPRPLCDEPFVFSHNLLTFMQIIVILNVKAAW